MQICSVIENKTPSTLIVTHNVIVDGQQTIHESLVSRDYLETHFDEVMSRHINAIKQSMKEDRLERDR